MKISLCHKFSGNSTIKKDSNLEWGPQFYIFYTGYYFWLILNKNHYESTESRIIILLILHTWITALWVYLENISNTSGVSEITNTTTTNRHKARIQTKEIAITILAHIFSILKIWTSSTTKSNARYYRPIPVHMQRRQKQESSPQHEAAQAMKNFMIHTDVLNCASRLHAQLSAPQPRSIHLHHSALNTGLKSNPLKTGEIPGKISSLSIKFNKI